MTAAAKPRKATPRRRPAARPTNGSAPPDPQQATLEVTNGAAAAGWGEPPPPPVAAEPEEFVPTTRPVETTVHGVNTPEHPYGDKKVFVHYPKPGSKAGDAPIIFPHISEVRPTVHFMWKLRKMNNQAIPNRLDQAFEWMDLAEIPDDIQERLTLLPEDEQGEVFANWFSAAITPPDPEVLPGES